MFQAAGVITRVDSWALGAHEQATSVHLAHAPPCEAHLLLAPLVSRVCRSMAVLWLTLLIAAVSGTVSGMTANKPTGAPGLEDLLAEDPSAVGGLNGAALADAHAAVR